MLPTSNTISTDRSLTLTEQIRSLGMSFGFQAVRFSSPSTEQHRQNYEEWLNREFHGHMQWLERNQDKRFDASLLHPGTRSVITVRLDYYPAGTNDQTILENSEMAYISRYALGRDYHKVLRNRLRDFSKAIEKLAGEHGQRPFVDSAPLMERQLAAQAGLGWIGKNSLLLSPGAGSWFFLGELCTDLELETDPPLPKEHCGSCNQCLVDCPTDAFVSEGILDARKCISYLTIEYAGEIPESLRSKMGNRIYGCDDCQLVCPHNIKAPDTLEKDFAPRNGMDEISLLEVFSWDEATFLKKTEGTAIRRIGYQQWQRNIAVALGNGPSSEASINALHDKLGKVSDLVDNHIVWALTQLQQ